MKDDRAVHLRRDRFYRARGGTARLLRIACGYCGSYLCIYQKDGNGKLRRLYWDRLSKATFVVAHTAGASQSDMRPAVCGACGHTVGAPVAYAPENRLAWRLLPGAVRRSRIER